MAIDEIIFTGVDPLVSIYMYRSSHFHHVVIAPDVTDLSPKRLIMLQIVTSFALLVPLKTLKSTGYSPLSPFSFFSPAELASMLFTGYGGAACACVSFVLSIFFYSKRGCMCILQSFPVRIYWRSLLRPLPYCFVQLCLVSCDVLTVLNHVYSAASTARVCRNGSLFCSSFARKRAC